MDTETNRWNTPALAARDLTIIIPVAGYTSTFQRCLNAVKRLEPPPAECIVVVDGPYPESAAAAEAAGCRVIGLSANGGPARARNAGARAAGTSILFFVDADVELRPESVQDVIDVFNVHPEIDAMMGSYDDAPAAPGLISQYRNLLHHYVHQMGNSEASTFWGACGAIRRTIFLELGGFDESYRRPCIEDIELGYRLKGRGGRIRLEANVQVKHLKRWTLKSMLRADLLDRAIPWTELIVREKNFINDLNLTTSSRLSVALAWSVVPAGVLGCVHPAAALWIPIALGGLVVLNLPTYRFFVRVRGVWFTLGVFPLHTLYFLVSGLGFAIGQIKHWWRSLPVDEGVATQR